MSPVLTDMEFQSAAVMTTSTVPEETRPHRSPQDPQSMTGDLDINVPLLGSPVAFVNDVTSGAYCQETGDTIRISTQGQQYDIHNDILRGFLTNVKCVAVKLLT